MKSGILDHMSDCTGTYNCRSQDWLPLSLDGRNHNPKTAASTIMMMTMMLKQFSRLFLLTDLPPHSRPSSVSHPGLVKDLPAPPESISLRLLPSSYDISEST